MACKTNNLKSSNVVNYLDLLKSLFTKFEYANNKGIEVNPSDIEKAEKLYDWLLNDKESFNKEIGDLIVQ